jgi:hypothetical protein
MWEKNFWTICEHFSALDFSNHVVSCRSICDCPKPKPRTVIIRTLSFRNAQLFTHFASQKSQWQSFCSRSFRDSSFVGELDNFKTENCFASLIDTVIAWETLLEALSSFLSLQQDPALIFLEELFCKSHQLEDIDLSGCHSGSLLEALLLVATLVNGLRAKKKSCGMPSKIFFRIQGLRTQSGNLYRLLLEIIERENLVVGVEQPVKDDGGTYDIRPSPFMRAFS